MTLDELIAVLAKKQELYPGVRIRVYVDDGGALMEPLVGAVGPDTDGEGLCLVLEPGVYWLTELNQPQSAE